MRWPTNARAVWSICLSAWLVGLTPAPARAADPAEGSWRSHLPEGWMAAVAVEDLASLDERLQELLPPWGVRIDRLGERVSAALPGGSLARRAWVIGLFERSTAGATSTEPFLLAPTDDFDRLATALSAEPAGGVALAKVLGFEVTLQPLEGWALLTPLSPTSAPVATRGASDGWPLAAAAPDLTAWVSPLGAAWLAEEVKRRAALGARQPAPTAGPLESLLRGAAPYAPLAKRLSGRALAVDLWVDERGDIAVRIDLRINDGAARFPGLAPAESPPAEHGSGGVIGWFETAGTPTGLVELAVGLAESRPEVVESRAYSPMEFETYADSLRQLSERVNSARFEWLSPGPDDPVAAVEFARFRTPTGEAQLGAVLREMSLHWNNLVGASHARWPLLTTIERLAPSDSPTRRAGWRLASDTVAASGDDDPAVVAALAGFYGPRGVLRRDFAPVAAGPNEASQADQAEWIASTLPAARTRRLATEGVPAPRLAETSLAEAKEGATDGPPPVVARGEVWIDRWVAWRRQIEDRLIGDAIGRRARPPMAESPAIRATVVQTGLGYRLEATLPRAAFVAAAEYWRSTPAPVRP